MKPIKTTDECIEHLSEMLEHFKSGEPSDEGFEALYEGLCMALDTIYSMQSELDRTRYETISMAYQIAGPGRVQ